MLLTHSWHLMHIFNLRKCGLGIHVTKTIAFPLFEWVVVAMQVIRILLKKQRMWSYQHTLWRVEMFVPLWNIHIFKGVVCDFAYFTGLKIHVMQMHIYCYKATHSLNTSMHTIRFIFPCMYCTVHKMFKIKFVNCSDINTSLIMLHLTFDIHWVCCWLQITVTGSKI